MTAIHQDVYGGNALSGALPGPEFLDALFRNADVVPEMLLKLGQTGLDGLQQFRQNPAQEDTADQRKITEETPAPHGPEGFGKDFASHWKGIYEKCFRPFLQIPQLGLTRGYQEKANTVMDRFHLFQAAMTEFMHMLSIPVEKTLTTLQKDISEMAETGEMPEDSRKVYRSMIKILEDHYTQLFQSNEYIQTQARALMAMSEYLSARDEMLENVLAPLSIPTRKEIDALERDLYEMKKRVHSLETQCGAHV